jgi:hypothetical protein
MQLFLIVALGVAILTVVLALQIVIRGQEKVSLRPS